MQDIDSNNDTLSSDDEAIHDARLWRDEGWTARVIKNEDDDGWAVEMSRDGEREPALIGPWTMGRDKKNPKPLDKSAFNTLVKTASEFIRRSEQQLHAQLHKHVTIDTAEGRIKVTLDIVPDDDFPYADLTAWDEMGDMLAKVQAAPNYQLNADSAQRWVASGYRRPG
ncbi:MAG: hypothetical protein GAK35_01584 [Herbaspirillum frisingense]|uniref:Uncharacterized protein n=1 Tax=Herbaspirillum frisingense TaxID=92645 RepID=A0A7V8FXQ4_9BURK|nr:MAG: hypothetical protein GAK35_01584 [Herbaspirillum frisingense]